MESNQKKMQKRSASIQMIATQSYSNMRSQRNKMMAKKRAKSQRKGSKIEEKQRQDVLLHTRKSQAAAQWASVSPLTSNNHLMEKR